MAAEEVTEAQLPFGMGSIDFSNPLMAVVGIVTLITGFAVFNMTQSIGEMVGSRVNQTISAATGVDTGDGSSENPPGMV